MQTCFKISILKDRLLLAAKSILKMEGETFLDDDQKMRSSEWKMGENNSEFAPEREFLTDNPQPSGPYSWQRLNILSRSGDEGHSLWDVLSTAYA